MPTMAERMPTMTGPQQSAIRGGAMPPQIEPPRRCACGASLGKLLRRHRHENRALANHWLSAGTNGNATALLLYAFTASGELRDGTMTSQVHYTGTDLQSNSSRRHVPTIAEPVLASSLGSLSRVTSTMGSRVSFMACPSLQNIVGRSGIVPAVDDVVPCDPPPTGLEVGGPLACFTVAMMAVQVAMIRRAAATPGLHRALIVETDMIWLGHPIAIYARWRHHRFPVVWDGRSAAGMAASPRQSPEPLSLDACDVRPSADSCSGARRFLADPSPSHYAHGLRVTKHPSGFIPTVASSRVNTLATLTPPGAPLPAPYSCASSPPPRASSPRGLQIVVTILEHGGLNSGVQLLRLTPAVLQLWVAALNATATRALKDGCLGGQNQAAILDTLGLPFRSAGFRAFRPGKAILAPDGATSVCALPYEQATLSPLDPIALQRRHEKVACPEELLASPHASNFTLIHLKSANRAPSHEFALGMLHDCMTAAEAHFLQTERLRGEGVEKTAASTELQKIKSQVVWAHAGLGLGEAD